MAAGELASEGPLAPWGLYLPLRVLWCPLQQAGDKEEDGARVGQTWARSSEPGPGRAGCSSGKRARDGG